MYVYLSDTHVLISIVKFISDTHVLISIVKFISNCKFIDICIPTYKQKVDLYTFLGLPLHSSTPPHVTCNGETNKWRMKYSILHVNYYDRFQLPNIEISCASRNTRTVRILGRATEPKLRKSNNK